MAKAMPPGNLILIVFLAAFRFAVPRIGLGWGMACGYAVALATLLAVEGLVRSVAIDSSTPVRSAYRVVAARAISPLSTGVVRAGRGRPSGGPWPLYGRRPRHAMRFSPRLESVPG
jgi:hypothetical protein